MRFYSQQFSNSSRSRRAVFKHAHFRSCDLLFLGRVNPGRSFQVRRSQCIIPSTRSTLPSICVSECVEPKVTVQPYPPCQIIPRATNIVANLYPGYDLGMTISWIDVDFPRQMTPRVEFGEGYGLTVTLVLSVCYLVVLL